MQDSEKREKIKQHVKNMFAQSAAELDAVVDKALNSGAVDVSSWDENYNPMILPKAILIAFLRNEANQYTAKGTSFEGEVREGAKNIGYHI